MAPRPPIEPDNARWIAVEACPDPTKWEMKGKGCEPKPAALDGYFIAAGYRLADTMRRV